MLKFIKNQFKNGLYCLLYMAVKFPDFIDAIVYFVSNFWSCISWSWQLSEKFIETFQDRVDWANISRQQKLSEEFIEKFQNKVDWNYISSYQKLSEEFIEKFQDKVHWYYIVTRQKLSEEFIEKNWNKINVLYVAMCQKLSEEFIKKIKDNADNFPIHSNCQSTFWKHICTYQKLSPQFRDNLKVKIGEDVDFENNWLYKDDNFKLTYIKEKTNYEVIDDKYIIAYKGIRSNNYSKMNFQHKYEVGKIYEDHCDCNSDNENSFGLSAWTIEMAKEYCNEKIIKVKIAISDIGCIVKNGEKIRCFRFEVI